MPMPVIPVLYPDRQTYQQASLALAGVGQPAGRRLGKTTPIQQSVSGSVTDVFGAVPRIPRGP
jgi:hypothetical protein